MILQTSARKLAAIAVSGAVIVVGGSAFAEQVMPADPVLIEEVDVPADETPVVEAPVEEPLAEEADTDEPDTEEPVVEEPVVLEETEDVEDVDLVDEAEAEVEEVEDTTVEEPAVHAHPDNHGAAVSEAAHAPTPEGARNHGEAVSAVARSNAGKPEGRGNGNGHKGDK